MENAGGTPCSLIMGLNRGSWTPEEDLRLRHYIEAHGECGWTTLQKKAGLLRSGKSCILHWMNYLRPDVKRGHILPDEEDLIIRLHRLLGNRWSLIARRMLGRTDNEIKNYWNTHLSKKLISRGIDPRTHKPLADSQDVMCSIPEDRETSEKSQWESTDKLPGNIMDSRTDLQDVAAKVAIAADGEEDNPAAGTGCAIPDPVIQICNDPWLSNPTATLGYYFNSDIFPLLMESIFADQELRLQESAEYISIEQNVQPWPSIQLEAANLSDDLWCFPFLSSNYYRFG